MMTMVARARDAMGCDGRARVSGYFCIVVSRGRDDVVGARRRRARRAMTTRSVVGAEDLAEKSMMR